MPWVIIKTLWQATQQKKRKNEANKSCANVARLQLVEFFKGIAGSVVKERVGARRVHWQQLLQMPPQRQRLLRTCVRVCLSLCALTGNMREFDEQGNVAEAPLSPLPL